MHKTNLNISVFAFQTETVVVYFIKMYEIFNGKILLHILPNFMCDAQ